LRLLASDQAQRVITSLASCPGGMTQAELSERTGIAQADVSRLVTRLAEHGVIWGERAQSPGSSGRPATLWRNTTSRVWEILKLLGDLHR
jgi:predicted ArsR family transcriptional regulator